MPVDFQKLDEVTVPHLNGGDGAVSARMYMAPGNKVMLSRLPAGTSIGLAQAYGRL